MTPTHAPDEPHVYLLDGWFNGGAGDGFITGNETFIGCFTNMPGNLAISCATYDPTAFTSMDVIVEESPSPSDVPDASAVWLTLHTFAVTGAALAKQVITDPHFTRMRVRVANFSGTSIWLALSVFGKRQYLRT